MSQLFNKVRCPPVLGYRSSNAMISLVRFVCCIFAFYAFVGIGMLWWHLSYGEPYFQATLPLMGIFALSSSLAGVVSVWTVHGMLHWANRMSGLIICVSVLAGVWLLFSEWNQFLIWQMVVLLACQLFCLVTALALGGRPLRLESLQNRADDSSQLSIGKLATLTGAFAIFFAVMRTVKPVELTNSLYLILFAGGCCAALTALTAFWVSFSNSTWFLRLGAFVIVAPIGGGVYAIAAKYQSLLFSWQWYAGVTTLQMFFMIVPFAVARVYGYALPENRTGGPVGA